MVDAHPPRRQAAIADVRHVRNGTGRYCTLRGYGQGQPHLPAASGNRDVKPGRLYSRRPHRLHHPPLRPCDIPRRLQKVHVLHTGESDAGRVGSFWLLGEATAELPDPKIHGHFTDRARSEHQDGHHRRCPHNRFADASSVRCCPANASPTNSNWHMTLPPLPVFRHGCPSEAGSQQHYNTSKFDHSRWPAAVPSRLQAT